MFLIVNIVYFLLQLIDDILQVRIGSQLFLYFVAGVHYGCIMLSSEKLSDLRKREVGHGPAEIHCNLARISDLISPFGGFQIVDFNIEMFADHILYLYRGRVVASVDDDIFKNPLRK